MPLPIVVFRCVVWFLVFVLDFLGFLGVLGSIFLGHLVVVFFPYAYISFHSYCGKILIGLPDMINNANIDDGMVRCTLCSHECATSVSCTILPESSLYSKIKRFMFLVSPRNVPETQISESSPQIQPFHCLTLVVG